MTEIGTTDKPKGYGTAAEQAWSGRFALLQGGGEWFGQACRVEAGGLG